ncbi:ABC transporter substrate-binding protein [Nocardioides sp. YIM 152315]|uniref:ABC transporter substrate-binding protein n=1 Tax=Nocardioides sp. YIM 152315 TaxID=3031760 RepID=UPI0023DB426A|nr:ABC transporter substrate-binding protein [Nocardioides sp. YIM 152315]MDF1602608.1 ABC transporter substrate-binding protein [Nocardioides sp. YIM 152315]
MNRRFLAVVGAGALALALVACGGDDDGGGGGSSGGGTTGTEWILGTTDSVTALDPAGSYDLGSSALQYAMYQQLLTVPPGTTTPEGDAAESCEYTDPKTFQCTLREGLTFSNGDPLTSSDVKFTVERNINIANPNGASVLLASLCEAPCPDDAIETPDDQTVIFHLSRADATFQYVLTHASAGSIVNEDVFPADSLLSDAEAVGSGPFVMADYAKDEQATLTKNDDYQGPREAKSSTVFVKYYPEASNLKVAVQNGEVDVAWRSLSPTDIVDLKDSSDLQVLQGEGAEIRYFVWQLSTPTAKQEAVRKAVAYLIDRAAISERAYDGTVEPLYSLVPPSFPGATESFKDVYGAEPDPAQAEKVLNDAGIKTPVDLVIGYTPTHYGPNAVDEATELQSQLNDSGLFKVALKNAEWEQYQNLYKEGAYDLFQLGWFPDFVDADNYISPFVVDGGFYANNYSNPKVNDLVAKEQGTDDQAVREDAFEQIQDIIAQDVSEIPSWIGPNIAIAGPGMEGVEETLDPAFIFRFWNVTKSG